MRSAIVLDAEKIARKEKIKAIKEEVKLVNEFMKKNEKALTEIQRLGEDDLAGIFRQEEQRKQVVQDAIDAGVKSRAEALVLINQIEADAAEQRAAIYNKELALIKRNQDERIAAVQQGRFKDLDLTKASEEEKKEVVVAAGKSALEQIAQVNKRAFQLNKAVAITEAIINTYQGATKALAQGGVFGPLLAGAIVASGLAQVAIIRNQQYLSLIHI